MKLIIFFHAAARKTIINCLVTTQHRPTPYEVDLHSAPKFIRNMTRETAISRREQYKINAILFWTMH